MRKHCRPRPSEDDVAFIVAVTCLGFVVSIAAWYVYVRATGSMGLGPWVSGFLGAVSAGAVASYYRLSRS